MAEVRQTTHTMQKLKESIENYKTQHEQDEARIVGIHDQLEASEKAIVGLQTQIQQYEAGNYNIYEATKEIKKMRLQSNIDAKEMTRLAKSVSDFQMQASDLAEENVVLRQKLGMQPTQLDISNLKISQVTELEKAKSLNVTLRSEIDGLEEERLDLKKKLRLHAMERGDRAVGLGLNASDLLAVQDYAEALRHGQVPHGVKDGKVAPEINLEQLDKLVIELERCHVDQEELRNKLAEQEVLFDLNLESVKRKCRGKPSDGIGYS